VFNDALAADYLKRSRHRLKALEVLLQEESWADVVRESQELVEIALKALLLACRVEVPRIHDVSPLLEENRERLPAGIREQVPELVRISRSLRRDRELAFYGSEDLTPSEFYHRDDAEGAIASARFVHAEVAKALEPLSGSLP
jgi:HEPN domain-containing protein